MLEVTDIQRDQLGGYRIAEATVTETSQILGVSSGKVSKVMTTYIQRGKTTLAKQNSGR